MVSELEPYLKILEAVIQNSFNGSLHPENYVNKQGNHFSIKWYLIKEMRWAIRDKFWIPMFADLYKVDEDSIRDKLVKNCKKTLRRFNENNTQRSYSKA